MLLARCQLRRTGRGVEERERAQSAASNRPTLAQARDASARGKGSERASYASEAGLVQAGSPFSRAIILQKVSPATLATVATLSVEELRTQLDQIMRGEG